MTNKGALIFSVQRFCLHDGPGIRTVIFFKGCPLSCKWCSNPESQANYPELMYNKRTCIGCGSCLGACPRRSIKITSQGVDIDREKCTLNGDCVKQCPTGALTMMGRLYSIEEILECIKQDLAYYNTSNGGITLSGGEPFIQHEVVLKILEACKMQGIHTAIETCGHVKSDLLLSSIELVDLYLYDIKAVAAKKHMTGTGVDNQLIIENLRKLIQLTPNIILRIPLIPKFNMDDEEYHKFKTLIQELEINRVDLIPYHNMGVSKYEALSKPCEYDSAKPADIDVVKQWCNRFRLETKADVRIS